MELRQRIEVLAPHNSKALKFSGDRPTRVLKLVPSLMRSGCKITNTNFFEDKFKWDNLSEDNDFYAQWRGKFSEDARTSGWIDVRVQGTENEKTKEGKVTIWLRAYLITKLSYKYSFMKSIMLAYARFFYSDQRRKYIEKWRRNVDIIERELRAQLGIR
jgi:hypothetical protein